MAGSKYITLDWKQSQMFRGLETWDSGLELVAFGNRPVWKFNARKAHGVNGTIKAKIIAGLMGINGRLV